MRFLCMQSKDVINICNGKKVGFVSDVEIDVMCYSILGIHVERSCYTKLLMFFKAPSTIYIPKENIMSIGEDVIIVNIPEN